MFAWYLGSKVCYAYLSDLKPDAQRKEGEAPDNDAASGPTEKEHDTESHIEHDSLAQRVAKYAHCRWFTRGWTLQELIAPRRLGFYNQNWEFQGEKSELSAVLTEITRISPAILDDASLLPTVPVAQRMSWVSRRETTREEDIAYCLLGIFDVHMPLLYGEGKRAFIRLQEEIIKDTNDPSLFGWLLDSEQASSQKHWGILAPSPAAFADCADIELRVDPMHNNECAITSKGLRFTPVPGGGLRFGERGMSATYVMNLQCRRRNRVESLGIFLEQQGCDVYTRVKPDKLSKSRRSSDDKHRTFYVTKTVPPAMAIMLRTSHRDAVNLSRALDTLGELKIWPAETEAFEPAGHWDRQRCMFLTRGTRHFRGIARFLQLVPGGTWRSLTITLLLYNENLRVLLEYDDASKNANDLGQLPTVNVLVIEPLPEGTQKVQLTARAVREEMDGQPVYFVMIDKLYVYDMISSS
ncbi:hypothetical protein N656DRAFT_783639 [Canariomyces notabilis]|uniref:Heterokaryon incompatibility domain-containing protein n=1 Tax=Canariomyces notabilis TaxID=2074819 RepID=A0AAN6T8R6_9PEZI|nr:hypothetical protein N656DRAFT_783639 [Canariomyces arenarius]